METNKENIENENKNTNDITVPEPLANYIREKETREKQEKDNESVENYEVVKINISDKTFPKMLSISDIESHLGISTAMVYKLVKTDGFPTIKIGKRILIPEDEYQKWIEKVKGTEISVN